MKKMKRLSVIVLIIAVLAMVLAGCAKESSGSGGGAKTSGFKVASHNAVIEGNAYRTVYEDQMTEAVRGLQASGIVGQYASFVSNNDPAVEVQQIEQTINEGYDIIIVNPIAANGLDPVIAKALAAGIVYVNADCEYESASILNVVVDQKEWARIQSDFVIKTLGSGKRVIQFNGIDGNSASEMRHGVWASELPAAGLQIVRTIAHNWNDTDAKRIMNEIIASGLQYDGIICQEGSPAILSAFEEANLPYPGCITSDERIGWIRKIADINRDALVLPFIVVENPPGIGATALAIAVNLRLGHELKAGVASAGLKGNSIYYAPQWIMTYDNIAQRLADVSALPDSTSVSSYMSVEQAKAAFFK
jgi:ABC-type sugar transport system substrate-binding protein